MSIADYIDQLTNIAKDKNERQQRAINNLIDRMKSFEEDGDAEKLSNCKGEAQLWIAR